MGIECSSADSEARCRRILLAMIHDVIELIEGSDWEFAASSASLSRRQVRVLVEPVDVVCEWDRQKRRSEFPNYHELLSLPPLPKYCTASRTPPEASYDAPVRAARCI